MIELEIPLPPRALSPNGAQGNWRKRAKCKKLHKEAAHILAVQNGGKLDGPARISCVWFMGSTVSEKAGYPLYRPLDIQNANSSLKAAIDGLVSAGMIQGDSHKLLTWGETVLLRSQKEHKGRSCVVLRLELIEAGTQPGTRQKDDVSPETGGVNATGGNVFSPSNGGGV
jgi:Holliday junction resolvase RusA-like endonuclease